MLTLELSSIVLEISIDVSDWLFNTQSRVLQADWLILENNDKATLSINIPYLFLDTDIKPVVADNTERVHLGIFSIENQQDFNSFINKESEWITF